MSAAPTQFIWLYFQGEARGDELRYSMRSVYRHFKGTPHIVLVGDAQHQPAIIHRQFQPVGPLMPGFPRAQRLEHVVLDQIEDRDPAFLFDIGIAPQDRRFIELDVDDPSLRHGRRF